MGKLYVWIYPETSKSYAGWHLNVDRMAAVRLSEAIERLATGSLRARQSFAVSPVTAAVLAVPNNRHAKARSARELRLLTDPDPRRFSLEESDGVLTLTVGSERLELRNNIIGITRGKGDFSMAAGDKPRRADQRLWFWW